ncbi:MAG: hypothetical protein ABFD96_05340, partial [Armatimonadia bacterium]
MSDLTGCAQGLNPSKLLNDLAYFPGFFDALLVASPVPGVPVLVEGSEEFYRFMTPPGAPQDLSAFTQYRVASDQRYVNISNDVMKAKSALSQAMHALLNDDVMPELRKHWQILGDGLPAGTPMVAITYGASVDVAPTEVFEIDIRRVKVMLWVTTWRRRLPCDAVVIEGSIGTSDTDNLGPRGKAGPIGIAGSLQAAQEILRASPVHQRIAEQVRQAAEQETAAKAMDSDEGEPAMGGPASYPPGFIEGVNQACVSIAGA